MENIIYEIKWFLKIGWVRINSIKWCDSKIYQWQNKETKEIKSEYKSGWV